MTSVADVLSGLSAMQAASVRNLLARTFPDPRCHQDDALVAAFVCGLPPAARAALGIADAAVDAFLAALVPTTDASDRIHGYYVAHATHTRLGQGAHRFTDDLPMVRVRLPVATPADLETAIGVVFAADHKVPTEQAFRSKYDDVLAFEVGHVMLTTPARYPRAFGARFGAIATYEAFDVQGERRAFVLEAGMATGEAMVLYCSPDGGPILRRAWYQPTPFSADRQTYRGVATWRENPDGPGMLRVEVRPPGATTADPPSVLVTVDYERLERAPEPVFPAMLTARAGLRVAAIAVARGSTDPFMHALAPFARGLFERDPQP